MFTIVEILKEKKIFHEVSRRIVVTFKNRIRLIFYFICLLSTISASILEDISVAIIFGPIIVIICVYIKINPTPFLLGMTICINLASTLTPFGSAENVLIFNQLDLTFGFFLKNLSVYFIIATILTLVLLDVFVLRKYVNKEWIPQGKLQRVKPLELEKSEILEIRNREIKSGFFTNSSNLEKTLNKQVDNKTFYLNLGAIVVFIVLLVVIPTIWVPTFISLVLFVIINPVKTKEDGKSRPNLSHFIRKLDFKLVFFLYLSFCIGTPHGGKWYHFISGIMARNNIPLQCVHIKYSYSYFNIFVFCIYGQCSSDHHFPTNHKNFTRYWRFWSRECSNHNCIHFRNKSRRKFPSSRKYP